VHDNEALMRAVGAANGDEDIVPVFSYDPLRWFAASRYGATCKTGTFRGQYLVESVNDLRATLRDLGSDLVISTAPAERAIAQLIPDGAECTVYAQQDIHAEEVEVERAVRAALPPGSRLELVWGSTLYHPDDLMPHVDVRRVPSPATKFLKLVEEAVQAGVGTRELVPTPAKGALGPIPDDVDAGRSITAEELYLGLGLEPGTPDPRSAFRSNGGETAALARWRHYLDSHAIATYFDTRNGMIGEDYSTKLGPALAHGCISPRYVARETRQYEAMFGANKSTAWIEFELLVRDYYKFYALTHGSAIFKPGGPVGKRRVWEEDANGEKFRRWKEGRTGWPLVDANMRELAATGFMSNRGRQNVASFLCLDLNLDWRLGADYFEHQLLDYDVASNWGNWVAAAGLTGGRVNKFNIVKQSRQYDPDGEYIKLWLPELEGESPDTIHEPRPGALPSKHARTQT
jgi:deoxyribodipyrimidine photo-lyase